MDAVGPYRLEALVGRGTAGAVWRATRPGPVAQVVAVKRAEVGAGGEATDRLRREAAILADLDHPHIVRVFDVLDDGDGVAIVMSLARGGSLHDLLEERGRLTPGETVAVLARVADALASAHRRGVHHGDVKPANVLFTTDGEPLLGDFGVAQHLAPGRAGLAGADAIDAGAGRLATVEGTAGFVDPDLVETGRPDPRNDVYALAVVAYLCLTGRPPHAGGDVREVLAAADAGDHLPLHDEPGVPAALADVVEAALARRPADRPASAAELAAGLRAAVDPARAALPGTAVTAGATGSAGAPAPALGDATAAPPAPDARRGTRAFGPRPPRPEARPPRRGALVPLLVVALVVGGVAAGLWVRDRVGAEQEPSSVAVAGGAEPRGVGCADLEPLEVPAGAEELSADFAGDGCTTQVVWDGQVMRFRADPDEARPRSYQFSTTGGPGQLLIGDWDCDGADSPALYQPGTGRVAYFAEVPEREGGQVEARTEDTGITEGQARLERDDGDGCDTVAVTTEA